MSGIQKSQATKLCAFVPNILGSLVCNLLPVTQLAPKLSKWLLDFCKMCAALLYVMVVCGKMTSKWVCRDVEGSDSVLIWGTVQAFPWRSWGKPRKPASNLTVFVVEVWLRDPPYLNTNQDSHPLDREVSVSRELWRKTEYPFVLCCGSRGILSHGDETRDDLRVVAFRIFQQQFSLSLSLSL